MVDTAPSYGAAEAVAGELVADLKLERRLRLVYRKHANLSHAARAFLKVAEGMADGQKYLFQPER